MTVPGVEKQVELELGRLNAIESVDGQVALALARKLDSPRNEMAVSGNARELRAVMAAIREAKPEKADSVDDSRGETDRILKLVGGAGA